VTYNFSMGEICIYGYELQKKYNFCNTFNTEGEAVLIKCHHLIRAVSSYRKNLNLIMFIIISKNNYKIVLSEACFNSPLQVLCKISVASSNLLTT
jgi:hypothetical protein